MILCDSINFKLLLFFFNQATIILNYDEIIKQY